MQITEPKRIRHTYTQRLHAPPSDVFPLLCPVREAEWVPGWNPVKVLSFSGAAEKDCVFITPGDPNATWVITHHDPSRYEVEMIKFIPNHTVTKLQIALHADGANATSADVTYTYTSLSPEGDAFVGEFTEAHYVEFMRNWEKELNNFLVST